MSDKQKKAEKVQDRGLPYGSWKWQDLMTAVIRSPAESPEEWPGLRPVFDPEFELPKSAKKIGRLTLALFYTFAQYVDTKFTAFEERRASVFSEAVKLNEASKANDIEELRTSARHLAGAMAKHEADLAELRGRSEVQDARLNQQTAVLQDDAVLFQQHRAVLETLQTELSELRANALGGLAQAGDAVAEVKRELGEVTASHHRMISQLQDQYRQQIETTTNILATMNDFRLTGATRQKILEEIAGLKSNALGGGNFANWAAGQRATTNEAVAACDSRLDVLSKEVEEIGQAVAELNRRVRNGALVSQAIAESVDHNLSFGIASDIEKRFNKLLERATEGASSAEEPATSVPAAPAVQLEKISDVEDEFLKAVRLEAQRHVEQLAAQPDAVAAALRRQNAAGPLPPEAMPEGVSAAGLFQQALSDGPEASEAGQKLAEILDPRTSPFGRIAAVREKAEKP